MVARMGGIDVNAGSDDDFVTIATFFDPTEARLLQGVLKSADLDAVVGDGNTVQMDQLLAIAVRVRVRVPASQVAAARRAMKDLQDGAFALEGDDALPAPPPPAAQPAPLFGPDAAALWSLPLTPLFGTVLMWLNARRDPAAAEPEAALRWLVVAGVAVAGALAFALASGRAADWLVARLALAGLTFVWYFAAAQPLSRAFIRRYGAMYRRAPTVSLALALLAAVLAARWAADLLG
jgi:hypothetical protein